MHDSWHLIELANSSGDLIHMASSSQWLARQELQRVFGHMQEGVAKVYDPAPFANLLGIDKGIQQDPQARSPRALPSPLPSGRGCALYSGP